MMVEPNLATIDGYLDLTRALGEPPEFHDGDVVSIRLDQDSGCSIVIEVTCFDRRRHNIEVVFRNVTNVTLSDWGKQNVILHTEWALEGGLYQMIINSSVGVHGSISAEDMEFRVPPEALTRIT
ncbi:MAG: hypothetical protein ACK4G5_17085 [Devosia sp.]